MAFIYDRVFKSEDEIYKEDLEKEFENKYSVREDFTEQVYEILKRVLSRTKINIASIEQRTKKKDSYIKKALDPQKSYSDPFKQITDISGIRIICYYNTDVSRIAKLVGQEFVIDEKNSVDKSTALGINSFGYRSDHKVVEMPAEKLSWGQYADFEGLKAEIQIRTVCQHAWASIEHSLNYKAENEMDKEIERRLYRISGLLEVADDEFLYVKRQIEKIRKNYKSEFSQDRVDAEITTDALDVYLQTVTRDEKIFSIAEKYNFYINPVHPNAKNPMYSLSQTLMIAGIDNIATLEQIIGNPDKKFTNFLKLVFRNWNTGVKPPKITVDKYTLLRMAVICQMSTKKKQLEVMRRIHFGPELHRSIMDTISSGRPSAIVKK